MTLKLATSPIILKNAIPNKYLVIFVVGVPTYSTFIKPDLLTLKPTKDSDENGVRLYTLPSESVSVTLYPK